MREQQAQQTIQRLKEIIKTRANVPPVLRLKQARDLLNSLELEPESADAQESKALSVISEAPKDTDSDVAVVVVVSDEEA